MTKTEQTDLRPGGVHDPDPDVETRIDTHRPDNVIAALARVEAEVGGIAKKTSAERGRGSEGVSYPYRGIDEIAQAAQPLLGRYGVVIVPTVENHVVDDITVGNKPWTDTTVHVLWKIYGPGGVTDMIEARTIGFGRDNSDKGMNKAMTGAYKNLLLRILSIGDPQDDTDGTTHERDEVVYLTAEQAQQVVDFVTALPEPHKTAAKNEIKDRWGMTKTIPATEWTHVEEFIARLNAIAAQDAAEQPDPDSDQQPEPTSEEVEAADRRAALAADKLRKAGLVHDEPNDEPDGYQGRPDDDPDIDDDGGGYG